MKKILFIILIIIIALVIYLNRSYAHIYNLIGEKNLPNPTLSMPYFVNSNTPENSSIIKIAFLGDSLTSGIGVNNLVNSYPYLLSQKLANKKIVQVLNLGIPGATSNDVLQKQIKLANEFKPDKIFILIGINDLHNRLGRGNLENNLRQIITDLKISPANIYLINIPYLGNFLPPYQMYFNWQTKKYNQIFVDLKAKGWQMIDLYSSTQKEFYNDQSLYATDLFHPNDAGYQLIAEKIFESIK